MSWENYQSTAQLRYWWRLTLVLSTHTCLTDWHCGEAAQTQTLLEFSFSRKKAVRTIAKLNSRESCRPAFQNLKLLTLPCLYMLETCLFFRFKCDHIRGSDVHSYATRGRENFRTVSHRTRVHERLPSQAGVQLVNRLPNYISSAHEPKAFKARLKNFLIAYAFYSTNEFTAYNWENVQPTYWPQGIEWDDIRMNERE